MTQTAAPSPPAYVADFVERLAKLSTGDSAILKRSAGCTIAESRGAAATFYKLYHGQDNDRDEEIFFLAATMFSLNKFRFAGDFGATMKVVRARGQSESIDRRMSILLNSGFDWIDGCRPGGGELAYRLRQLVKLSASKEVGIDWARLLVDLKAWPQPNRRTQKRWARSYFSTTQTGDTDNSQNSSEKGIQ